MNPFQNADIANWTGARAWALPAGIWMLNFHFRYIKIFVDVLWLWIHFATEWKSNISWAFQEKYQNRSVFKTNGYEQILPRNASRILCNYMHISQSTMQLLAKSTAQIMEVIWKTNMVPLTWSMVHRWAMSHRYVWVISDMS